MAKFEITPRNGKPPEVFEATDEAAARKAAMVFFYGPGPTQWPGPYRGFGLAVVALP